MSGSIPESQVARFEEQFLPLLQAGSNLSSFAAEIIDDFRLDGVPGDQFPEATVLRLLMGTDPLYRSAVHCLRRADTSFGSYALLRPMLDSWAHLWHIMNSGPAKWACQALRLELGWATAHAQKLLGSRNADASAESAAATERLREIKELFDGHRCRGGTRTYRNVEATLKEMEQQLSARWLVDMYDGSSRVIHASGHDWLTIDNGDGTSSLIDPAPSHRAARLNHLTILFHGCVSTTLVLLGLPGDAPAQLRFSERANDILRSRLLSRALDGDYDER